MDLYIYQEYEIEYNKLDQNSNDFLFQATNSYITALYEQKLDFEGGLDSKWLLGEIFNVSSGQFLLEIKKFCFRSTTAVKI